MTASPPSQHPPGFIPSLGAPAVEEITMDTVHAAVSKSPGKVVDGLRAVMQHQEELIAQLIACPVLTEAGVRKVAELQGRITAVQDLVQIFTAILLEKEDEGMST